MDMKIFHRTIIVLALFFLIPGKSKTTSIMNETGLPQFEIKKECNLEEKDYNINNPQASKWFWDFINWNDMDGWTVSDSNTGVVTGGTLWLSIETEQKDHHPISWKDQITFT